MKKTMLFFLLCALTGFSMACKSDDPTAPSSDVLTLDEFPKATGSVWVYERLNKMTGILDTVTVVITETVSGGTSTVFDQNWQFRDSGGQVDQIQEFYPEELFLTWMDSRIQTRLAFPMEVGDLWSGALTGDTLTVVEKTNLDVPAGIFSGVFHLTGGWNYPDNALGYDIWLVQDKGIAKIDFAVVGIAGIVLDESWELMSFSPTD